MEIVEFEHKQRKYQIRVVSDGSVIYVKAFYKNKAANGYRYSIAVPNAVEIEKLFGLDAVQDLILCAKNDVINESWEAYASAVNRLSKS